MKLGAIVLNAVSAFDLLMGTSHKCDGLNPKEGTRIENVFNNKDWSIEKRMPMNLATEKIVGGRPVDDIKNWNWIGQLHGQCGGSLIADDMFLTAAHCCARTRVGQNVYFGVLNPWENESEGQTRKVEEMVSHPDYVRLIYTHDICMIKLDSSIIQDRNVRPICLADSPPATNTPAYVAGWGLTSEGGIQSKHLMEVSVPVVTNEECQNAHSGYLVDDSMLCAGKIQGGQDTCQGDSGGPIVSVDRDGKVTLAGVASWGVGCARPGSYGVYSRVDTQLDFIHWAIQTLRGEFDGKLSDFDFNKSVLSGAVSRNEFEPEISTGTTCELSNVHQSVRVEQSNGKKGSTKFSFSCSSGVSPNIDEVSCYNDGKFYKSKSDKKKNRPFDTATEITCQGGGSSVLEQKCDEAFTKFFEDKNVDDKIQVPSGLKQTSNGIELDFFCVSSTKMLTANCKEGKKGKVNVELLGGKSTKKAFKKC